MEQIWLGEVDFDGQFVSDVDLLYDEISARGAVTQPETKTARPTESRTGRRARRERLFHPGSGNPRWGIGDSPRQFFSIAPIEPLATGAMLSVHRCDPSMTATHRDESHASTESAGSTNWFYTH